jgi:hypothetical protein
MAGRQSVWLPSSAPPQRVAVCKPGWNCGSGKEPPNAEGLLQTAARRREQRPTLRCDGPCLAAAGQQLACNRAEAAQRQPRPLACQLNAASRALQQMCSHIALLHVACYPCAAASCLNKCVARGHAYGAVLRYEWRYAAAAQPAANQASLAVLMQHHVLAGRQPELQHVPLQQLIVPLCGKQPGATRC